MVKRDIDSQIEATKLKIENAKKQARAEKNKLAKLKRQADIEFNDAFVEVAKEMSVNQGEKQITVYQLLSQKTKEKLQKKRNKKNDDMSDKLFE